MKTLSFCLLLALTSVPAYASEIEIGFSPDQQATDRIVRFLGEAKKRVRVAAYSFTSVPIAKAILNAQKRGVDVKVVLDKSQKTARYSSATFLKNEEVPTRIDYRYAIMHNKYIIVDGESVELGSFNFTKAAEEKNAENLIILRHQPDVAQAYEANWQKLWDESKDY